MSNAQNRLEYGAKFPYDAPDSWNQNYPNVTALPATDWAHQAARGVLADLCDRHGIRQELDGLGEDVRIELVESFADIIRTAKIQAK